MEYDDIGRGPEVAEAVREFVEETVLPVEREWLGRGPIPPAEIEALRDAARDEGIYAPQVDEEYGGLGLGFREMLPVFEEAGRSLLGPTALRCAAPDEGNMHTLEIAATEDQKERWLRPLAAGEIDSGFAMTEPMGGGGSDPKMLGTTAEKDGD
ncbi:acyl-CoA dehydrogenase, partial [Halorubrum distributum]